MKIKGSSLLEMLIALVILLVLSQLMIAVYAVIIKQAKYHEAVLLAQIEAENTLELASP